MGYIHCCSAMHKTRSFMLQPDTGFVKCELDYLENCPICGHLIIQLWRKNINNEKSTLRYTNKKAQKYLAKLKNKILYEKK